MARTFSFSLSVSFIHTHTHTIDGQTDISGRELRVILMQDCLFCASSTPLWHCHATAAGACEFQSLGHAQQKGCRCVRE